MMTIYDLAIAHVEANGMSPEDADRMITKFGAGEGRDIGWADIAPRLSPVQVERIDRAAVGWLMANRQAICEGRG
jgi:hypothetical protein